MSAYDNYTVTAPAEATSVAGGGGGYSCIVYEPYPYLNTPCKPVEYCDSNWHVFECRHETRCKCGRTERIVLTEGV